MTATATQTLTHALTQLIDDRVRVALDQYQPESHEWLNSKSAAAYLDCPVSRIHDLVAIGRLVPHREGTRLLFARADLRSYVEGAL
jgi:hypothetical protein